MLVQRAYCEKVNGIQCAGSLLFCDEQQGVEQNELIGTGMLPEYLGEMNGIG